MEKSDLLLQPSGAAFQPDTDATEATEPDFGDDPGGPLRLALWRRGQEFLFQLDRARSGEKGSVHECRVASRRLQFCLEFLFPVIGKKPGHRLSRAIHKARRALSNLRDLQVQHKWVSKHPELSELDEFLTLKHEQQSDRAGRKLKRISLGKLELGLEILDAHVAGATEDQQSFDQVLTMVAEGIRHSLELAGEALQHVDGQRSQSYHRLRLQLKRFRYQMELLAELPQSDLLPQLRSAHWEQLKALHHALGSIQDGELLARRLDRYWSRRPPVRRLQHRILGQLLKERDKAVATVNPAQLNLAAWFAGQTGQNGYNGPGQHYDGQPSEGASN